MKHKLALIVNTMVMFVMCTIGLSSVCYAATAQVSASGTSRIEAETIGGVTYVSVVGGGAAASSGADSTLASPSGSGKYRTLDLRPLATPPETLPAGGSTMTFSINVEQGGYYQFGAVTSSAGIVSDYSPYSIKINNGDYKKVNASLIQSYSEVGNRALSGGANGGLLLNKYQYNPIYLNQGANTITFMVDTLSTLNRYFICVDYIELTPTTAPVENYSYKINSEEAVSTGGLVINSTLRQFTTQAGMNINYLVDTLIDGETARELKLSVTGATAPAAGTNVYTFTYTVDVAEAGTYRFDGQTSRSSSSSGWYSKYNIKVNNDNYFLVDDSITGNVISRTPINTAVSGNEWSLYQYKDIKLQKGINTITFKVDSIAPSQTNGTTTPPTYKYVTNFDYIKLTLKQATVAASGATRFEAENISGCVDVTSGLGGIVSTGTASTYASASKYLTMDFRTLANLQAIGGQATMTFNVRASKAGLYQMEGATSTIGMIGSYSPYYLKVNNGDYKLVNSGVADYISPMGSAITSANAGQVLTQYRFQPVYLNEGLNTITFMINQTGKAVGAWYLMCVDYIELTPMDVPSVQNFSTKMNVEDAVPSGFDIITYVAYANGSVAAISETDGEMAMQLKSVVQSETVPTNEYTFTFNVNAPVSGTYKFEGLTSKSSAANGWISRYNIKVNNDNYFLVEDVGTVKSVTPIKNTTTGYDWSLYQYKDIQLNAGNNTITFMVNKPAPSQTNNTTTPPTYKYYMNLDYIKLTLIPTEPQVTFTGSNSNVVYSMSEFTDGTMNATANISNFANNIANVTLIGAVYDINKRLKAISTKDYTLLANSTQALSLAISNSSFSSTDYCKIFVVGNTTSIKPITPIFTFN